MGLAWSIESVGHQMTDKKTVKEGFMIALGYIAIKGAYNSIAGGGDAGGGGGE